MPLLGYNRRLNLSVFQKRLCTKNVFSKCRCCVTKAQLNLVAATPHLQVHFKIKPPLRSHSNRVSYNQYFFKIRSEPNVGGPPRELCDRKHK